MKNFLALQRFSLINNYFAFLDAPEYLADQLFIQHQVRVRFGVEFTSPDGKYLVILCRVRKWNTSKFLAALEELPNKMLLCGHEDYLEYNEDFWAMIDKAVLEGTEPEHQADRSQDAG